MERGEIHKKFQSKKKLVDIENITSKNILKEQKESYSSGSG
jgi:hypothetical protein